METNHRRLLICLQSVMAAEDLAIEGSLVGLIVAGITTLGERLLNLACL